MIEQNTPKMTHDEMIDALKGLVFGTFDRTTAKEREALNMAIMALKFRSNENECRYAEQEQTDEWQNRDFNIECQNHNAMLHKAQENVIEKFKSCADMLSDEELEGANLVMEWVCNAPSVRPQELTSSCDLCKFNTKLMLIEANVSGYAQGLKESSKTGHWIKIVVNGQHKIKCDKCDYTEPEYATHIRNYCPSCGAKMVEPQESEE